MSGVQCRCARVHVVCVWWLVVGLCCVMGGWCVCVMDVWCVCDGSVVCM